MVKRSLKYPTKRINNRQNSLNVKLMKIKQDYVLKRIGKTEAKRRGYVALELHYQQTINDVNGFTLKNKLTKQVEPNNSQLNKILDDANQNWGKIIDDIMPMPTL